MANDDVMVFERFREKPMMRIVSKEHPSENCSTDLLRLFPMQCSPKGEPKNDRQLQETAVIEK